MNILTLQRGRAGEILMTTPALRALKARFPRAEVTYLCEAPLSSLLQTSALVDAVLPVKPGAGLEGDLRLVASLRREKFNLALDFEGSRWSAMMTAGSGAARRIGFSSGLHGYAYTDRVGVRAGPGAYAAAEKLALLGPLGIDLKAVDQSPALDVEETARDWALRTLEAAGIGSGQFLITLAPGARTPELRWPLERYARLLDALAATHAFEVILILDARDKPFAAELARLTDVPLLQLDAPLSLPLTAALLDRSDLHVGNENAPRHIAAALGTATLTHYAPGMRRRWTLPGDPLQAGLEPRAEVIPADGGPLPIAGITVEEAHATLLKLEAYLPRLRAARRESQSGQPRPLQVEKSNGGARPRRRSAPAAESLERAPDEPQRR